LDSFLGTAARILVFAAPFGGIALGIACRVRRTRSEALFGAVGLFLGWAAPVVGFTVGIVIAARVGGDIAGISGMVFAMHAAAIIWSVSLLFGIAGLISDIHRLRALCAVPIALAGQMLLVLTHYYSFVFATWRQ
jgi:hypothetical protein